MKRLSYSFDSLGMWQYNNFVLVPWYSNPPDIDPENPNSSSSGWNMPGPGINPKIIEFPHDAKRVYVHALFNSVQISSQNMTGAAFDLFVHSGNPTTPIVTLTGGGFGGGGTLPTSPFAVSTFSPVFLDAINSPISIYIGATFSPSSDPALPADLTGFYSQLEIYYDVIS